MDKSSSLPHFQPENTTYTDNNHDSSRESIHPIDSGRAPRTSEKRPWVDEGPLSQELQRYSAPHTYANPPRTSHITPQQSNHPLQAQPIYEGTVEQQNLPFRQSPDAEAIQLLQTCFVGFQLNRNEIKERIKEKTTEKSSQSFIIQNKLQSNLQNIQTGLRTYLGNNQNQLIEEINNDLTRINQKLQSKIQSINDDITHLQSQDNLLAALQQKLNVLLEIIKQTPLSPKEQIWFVKENLFFEFRQYTLDELTLENKKQPLNLRSIEIIQNKFKKLEENHLEKHHSENNKLEKPDAHLILSVPENTKDWPLIHNNFMMKWNWAVSLFASEKNNVMRDIKNHQETNDDILIKTIIYIRNLHTAFFKMYQSIKPEAHAIFRINKNEKNWQNIIDAYTARGYELEGMLYIEKSVRPLNEENISLIENYKKNLQIAFLKIHHSAKPEAYAALGINHNDNNWQNIVAVYTTRWNEAECMLNIEKNSLPLNNENINLIENYMRNLHESLLEIQKNISEQT